MICPRDFVKDNSEWIVTLNANLVYKIHSMENAVESYNEITSIEFGVAIIILEVGKCSDILSQLSIK
jgi:hypothetical protein